MQREALKKAELRLGEAKELTKELRDQEVNDPAVREQDRHRKCLEFDKRRLELKSLIAILEDSLAPQQGGGGAA